MCNLFFPGTQRVRVIDFKQFDYFGGTRAICSRDQHVMEGQLLQRMLHAAGAQLGTRAVGVGSQKPVKTYLELDKTFLIWTTSGRGGPWGWKVLLLETGTALLWKWFSKEICLLGRGT